MSFKTRSSRYRRYSNISKDFNPVHVNTCFSGFTSLPGTSAASRMSLESVVGEGHPERVKL